LGNVFPFGSMSLSNLSNFAKLFPVHPFIAFKFINLNTDDNGVKLVEPGYKGVFASLNIFSKTALAKDYAPTSESCPPIYQPLKNQLPLKVHAHLASLTIHHATSMLYNFSKIHHTKDVL